MAISLGRAQILSYAATNIVTSALKNPLYLTESIEILTSFLDNRELPLPLRTKLKSPLTIKAVQQIEKELTTTQDKILEIIRVIFRDLSSLLQDRSQHATMDTLSENGALLQTQSSDVKSRIGFVFLSVVNNGHALSYASSEHQNHILLHSLACCYDSYMLGNLS